MSDDVSLVQSWIEVAAENEVWRILGYISLDTFLVAEANVSQSIIDSIRNAKKGTTIAEARANPAAKHGEIGKGRVRNSNSKLEPGDNNKRILANLARDKHDELLDQIEAVAKKEAVKRGPKPKGSNSLSFNEIGQPNKNENILRRFSRRRENSKAATADVVPFPRFILLQSRREMWYLAGTKPKRFILQGNLHTKAP